MNKVFRIVLVLLLFGMLILIRAFASDLFYDPLIAFFKTTHSVEALPELQKGKLLLHTILRFLLNTLVSILVLWVLFRKKDVIKISWFLYLSILVLLAIAFSLLVDSTDVGGHMALFYVRRFLIQPILLLVLIPAFYFQKNP